MIPLRDDNPTRRMPVVTYVLLASCIAAFLWQISHGPDFAAVTHAYGLVPAELFGTAPAGAPVPPEVTVLTSMFLHGGWMHLIFNMLFLYVYANNVEDSMGRGRFLVFYLLCGVAAAAAHAVPYADSTIPMVGASGAISGVLGAYLLLYPRSRILVLVPLIVIWPVLRLPAAFVLGVWFLTQLVQSMTVPEGGGGVAFGAHIGGFVAGMALIPFFKRRDVRLFSRWSR